MLDFPLTPAHLDLPFSSWRVGQPEAITNSYCSKKRFVGQDAPTGCGKSTILLGEHRISNIRTLILTGSKELQNQYGRQFKHLGLVDVRGKSNYYCRATELGGEFYDGSLAKSVDEGPCQFGIDCSLRLSGCTYYDLIKRASYAKLVVANYAAWISANLYTEGWGHFPLIMLDEAHEAESWLARMMAIHLPWGYNHVLPNKFPRTDSSAEWVLWATTTLPLVRSELKKEKYRVSTTRHGGGKIKAKVKALMNAERLLLRIRQVTDDWLILRQKEHVLFHPVWVHKYAESLLFDGAEKVVLASATLRPHTFNLLGVANGEFDFFEYPSTFPVERRPIYYYPVVKMHRDMDAEDHLEWLSVVDEFISKRLDRKGIIHTVSFARQQQLMKHSKYSSLMVANASSGAIFQGSPTTSGPTSLGGTASGSVTLQKFRLMEAPTVLTTPSMGTGVNLPYKDCEYTIIPKFPFESLGDPLVMARNAKDPEDGLWRAAEKLTQSIGRAMRADDDQNETLITDTMFGMFLGPYRYMLPKWILDAVIIVDHLPEPLKAL